MRRNKGVKVMVHSVLAELRRAVVVMVGEAQQAEDAALLWAAEELRRGDQQCRSARLADLPVGAEPALRLCGEIHQLRERAERVASTIAGLTERMDREVPPQRPE